MKRALPYLASKLPYNELHLKQLYCKLGYIKLDPSLVQACLELGSSLDLLSLNQAWKLPYFRVDLFYDMDDITIWYDMALILGFSTKYLLYDMEIYFTIWVKSCNLPQIYILRYENFSKCLLQNVYFTIWVQFRKSKVYFTIWVQFR